MLTYAGEHWVVASRHDKDEALKGPYAVHTWKITKQVCVCVRACACVCVRVCLCVCNIIHTHTHMCV